MEDFGVTMPEQHPAVSQLEMTKIQYMTINSFRKNAELNCFLLTVHLMWSLTNMAIVYHCPARR